MACVRCLNYSDFAVVLVLAVVRFVLVVLVVRVILDHSVANVK